MSESLILTMSDCSYICWWVSVHVRSCPILPGLGQMSLPKGLVPRKLSKIQNYFKEGLTNEDHFFSCKPRLEIINSVQISLKWLKTFYLVGLQYFVYMRSDLQRHLHDSIVVSIPACHAGDRGSIPRRGVYFSAWWLNNL